MSDKDVPLGNEKAGGMGSKDRGPDFLQTTTRRERMALAIHYPEHWDTATYPTLEDAIYEIVTNEGCSECRFKETVNAPF